MKIIDAIRLWWRCRVHDFRFEYLYPTDDNDGYHVANCSCGGVVRFRFVGDELQLADPGGCPKYERYQRSVVKRLPRARAVRR